MNKLRLVSSRTDYGGSETLKVLKQFEDIRATFCFVLKAGLTVHQNTGVQLIFNAEAKMENVHYRVRRLKFMGYAQIAQGAKS